MTHRFSPPLAVSSRSRPAMLLSLLTLIATNLAAAPSLKNSLQWRPDSERPIFNRDTREFVQHGMLRNISGNAVQAPIAMAINGYSPDNSALSLYPNDGEMGDGSPFVVLLAQGQLAGGAEIPVSVSFRLTNELNRLTADLLEELAGKAFKTTYSSDQQASFNYQYDLVRMPAGNRAPLAKADAVWRDGRVLLNGADSSDADNQSLRYQWTLTQKPAGSQATILDPTLAATQFTPDREGSYTVSLQVSDGYEDSKPDAITLSITPDGGSVDNRPPIITSVAIVSGTGTRAYSYPVTAFDSDGDTLTYSLVTYPAGMTINAATGTINWTAPQPHHDGMKYNVVVKVSDGKGGETTQSFAIAVKICTCV